MQVRVGEGDVLVLQVITSVGSGTAKVEVLLVSGHCRTVATVEIGVFTYFEWL